MTQIELARKYSMEFDVSEDAAEQRIRYAVAGDPKAYISLDIADELCVIMGTHIDVVFHEGEINDEPRLPRKSRAKS